MGILGSIVQLLGAIFGGLDHKDSNDNDGG